MKLPCRGYTDDEEYRILAAKFQKCTLELCDARSLLCKLYLYGEQSNMPFSDEEYESLRYHFKQQKERRTKEYKSKVIEPIQVEFNKLEKVINNVKAYDCEPSEQLIDKTNAIRKQIDELNNIDMDSIDFVGSQDKFDKFITNLQLP